MTDRRWTSGLGAVLLAATAPGTPPAAAQTPAADTLRFAGLHAPVEIVTDRWGVAHIYATNEADLFFAQGYIAARERLFQFEVWRRQATGTLAEVLGERELDRDIAARLFRFRGDLDREMAHYHPRGKAIIESFVRGVNAWIAETEREPALLPLEFRLLGWTAGRWTPEVVLSRHQGLVSNATQELNLARAVARLGGDAVKRYAWFHPGEPDLALDAALDASIFDEDLLALYTTHKSGVRFRPEDVIAAYRADATGAGRAAGPDAVDRSGFDEHAVFEAGAGIGSNNWVVSGRRTATGHPFMANDPHRAIQAPSLRFFVHLVAPGWNVIGGGEPVLPGVSIGHNGHGAWGLTVFGVDSEDLYVYETDPADADRYRYRDGWETMRVERDTILVRGRGSVEVELRFTRHGPVLWADPVRGAAVALRAAWLDYGAAPYLASLRMNQATTWEAFRDACRYSHIPGENMVWADRAGTIGWQAVGVAPLRPPPGTGRVAWTGLLPVPGDGRYEWEGYLPIEELPHVENPAKGYWQTANQNLVGADYAHRRAIAWSWADPFRGDRIEEVLGSGRRLTMMDMMRLQHDELALAARSLVPLLRPIAFDDARAARARALLLAWDHVLDRESAAAAIYIAWERALTRTVRETVVPPDHEPHAPAIPLTRTIEWLLAPDGRFGRDPLAGRDSLLAQGLRAAVADLTDRLGPDPDAWRYGHPRMKHVRIRHPLGDAVSAEVRSRLEFGPAPRGGYGHTPNATGNADNQTSGASFRVIIDVGDWDRSVATNTPGQSGDPDSPYYGSLFEHWVEGTYFPLLYSRERIEGVADRRTILLAR
jgi:penicillin amidase